MGHMTKSSRTFCTILKSHPDVLDQLRQCCFEEDSHVRKVEKKKENKIFDENFFPILDGIFRLGKFYFYQ
jgi:hypothetical protein